MVPGSPVSTHTPPLLARTRQRSWYRHIGSSKLHKCPIYPISNSTQLPSTFMPSTLATSALTLSYGFTEFSLSCSTGSDVSFTNSPGRLSMTLITSTTSETQLLSTFTPSTLATSALMPSYGFTEVSSTHSAGSNVSFADSLSTLSRAREICRRFAGTARTYSSGYLTDASHSESERENEDHEGNGSRSPSGMFMPGSAHSSLSRSYSGGGRGSLSGSGNYLDTRSRTPTRSYTGSYSGSERLRMDSCSGGGS